MPGPGRDRIGAPPGWRSADRISAGGDGGGSNSPSRTISRRPLRACPMLCRRPSRRPSAVCWAVQSRVPGSGLVSGYATLAGAASPLSDASTAHGEEAASTLTLPPKRRGREQAGGCQLLRFAACFTRPDGTSARVPRGSGPVETTHPRSRSLSRPDHRFYARTPVRTRVRARRLQAPAPRLPCTRPTDPSVPRPTSRRGAMRVGDPSDRPDRVPLARSTLRRGSGTAISHEPEAIEGTYHHTDW